MSRDSGNNRQMRERIAQLAARLMAVDGIDDFALAKRKAARQAGAPDTRNLNTAWSFSSPARGPRHELGASRVESERELDQRLDPDHQNHRHRQSDRQQQ